MICLSNQRLLSSRDIIHIRNNTQIEVCHR